MTPTETNEPFHKPIKDAFGEYLRGFFENTCMADTAATASWLDKDFANAVLVVPERMQDNIQSMLDKYRQKSSPTQQDSTSSLPIMFVAFAKTWTPIFGDYGHQQHAPLTIMLDNDPKERVFKARLMMGSLRVQVAIVATEPMAVKSIISQFCLYVTDTINRRFYADYTLAGIKQRFPVVVQDTDIVPTDWDTNTKLLNVNYVDFDLKITIPMLITPKNGEPNDGKGTDGDKNDPHGFRTSSNSSVMASGVIG